MPTTEGEGFRFAASPNRRLGFEEQQGSVGNVAYAVDRTTSSAHLEGAKILRFGP